MRVSLTNRAYSLTATMCVQKPSAKARAAPVVKGKGGASSRDGLTTDMAPSRLLRPMQMVRCLVLGHQQQQQASSHSGKSAGGKKSFGSGGGRPVLSLSMRPSLVNQGLVFEQHVAPGFPVYGCVQSCEDHG